MSELPEIPSALETSLSSVSSMMSGTAPHTAEGNRGTEWMTGPPKPLELPVDTVAVTPWWAADPTPAVAPAAPWFPVTVDNGFWFTLASAAVAVVASPSPNGKNQEWIWISKRNLKGGNEAELRIELAGTQSEQTNEQHGKEPNLSIILNIYAQNQPLYQKLASKNSVSNEFKLR